MLPGSMEVNSIGEEKQSPLKDKAENPAMLYRVPCFSKESSATNRFSRLFSSFNSFSRFACSSFSPPSSLRQR